MYKVDSIIKYKAKTYINTTYESVEYSNKHGIRAVYDINLHHFILNDSLPDNYFLITDIFTVI